MRYEFHPLAEAEYLESVAYYEGCRKGLGLRFVEAFEATILRIQNSPTIWRYFDDEIRRCLLEKFPFGVLYTIERDHILVVAVMHHSRKPGYWKKRI